MYFKNRAFAGQELATRLLERHPNEECAVIALTDGAVLVGEQIAAALHAVITMLVVEQIEVPGEGLIFGGVSQTGQFTYNSELSSGEIEGYTSEYHGYLQEKKREAFQRINRLIGDSGLIDHDLLRDKVIILVSDGFADSTVLDVALDFLKPVRVKRLVIAAPVASERAVDRLHVVADELHILDVKTNFFNTNHYYDDNEMPEHEDIIKRVSDIIASWR